MKRGAMELFGSGAVLDHVGVGAARIDDVYPGLDRIADPIQKVSVGFFELHGVTIEAIAPATDDSPVSRSVAAGQKLLHLCYRVPDLDRAIATARSRGLLPLGRPVPAVAFPGRRIAWLYHKYLGLFELVEDETEG